MREISGLWAPRKVPSIRASTIARFHVRGCSEPDLVAKAFGFGFHCSSLLASGLGP